MNTAPSSRNTLSQLLAGLGVHAPDLEVSGVEMDSRRVSPGDLFIAAKGRTSHGLMHVEQAVARGAAAVAWEPASGISRPEIGVPEVAVPELARHVSQIAAHFYGYPAQKIFCVGVTGTDGKTSTAHLIAQALQRLQIPCAYMGTLGHGLLSQIAKTTHTTPDPISVQRLLAQFVEEGAHAVAMEVSSHALDQDRIAGIKFDVAILTNITRDHLDYHGTVENYAAAKRRLFSSPQLKAAVLNRDDAHGLKWAAQFPAIAVVYGIEGEAPSDAAYVLGRNLQLHSSGLRFDIDSSWGKARIESKLLGRFNVYNLLAALAALLHRGIALQPAVDALSQAVTVPGRIEAYRGPAARPLVVVDYAHTPDALTQILTAVRAHTEGRLHCVFGCGGDRDRGKRSLMGAAAAKLADVLIVTDDNPRSEKPEAIVADILEGVRLAVRSPQLRIIHDRAEAIRSAVEAADGDDAVVIAGKGHEDTQTYGNEIRSFSDRAFVADLVGAQA